MHICRFYAKHFILLLVSYGYIFVIKLPFVKCSRNHTKTHYEMLSIQIKHEACIMRACVYLLSIWDGQLRIIGICYMFVYQKFINKSVVQQFFVTFGHCSKK